MQTSVGATRAEQSSILGHETVGIQDQVGLQERALCNSVQYFNATALLDQLKYLGNDVKEHCRRLWEGNVLPYLV